MRNKKTITIKEYEALSCDEFKYLYSKESCENLKKLYKKLKKENIECQKVIHKSSYARL